MKVGFLALLLLFSLVSANQGYTMHLVIYRNDTVELKEFNMTYSGMGWFPTLGKQYDNYLLKIVDKDGQELFSQTLHITFEAYPFQGPNSTLPNVAYFDKREYIWDLPYFDDASRIQLYHGGKMIFEYNISQGIGTTQPPGKSPEIGWDFAYCAIAAVLALLVGIFVLSKLVSRKKSGGVE